MADSLDKLAKKREGIIITALIIWIIIFGSIILALRIGLISNKQIQITQTATKDKIDVSGYAEVTENADMVEIFLGVENQNAIASTSQKENANFMQKVYREVYSYVKKEDVETYTYNMYPVIDYESGQQIIGYKTTHILKIRASPSDAGKIIDSAVNAGANRVNDIVFTLSEARKEAVGADALRKALQNAGKKAELIAAEMNVNLKKPVYISAEYTSVVPYYATRELAAGTEISAGNVKVTASVSVSYSFE
jgi:uncharacterized protein YggE